MHYKRMYDDKEFLYEFDLDGRDVTATIEKVTAGEIEGEKGRKSKKPIIRFVGKTKKLAINKTNGKIIAALYGTDTEAWVGQSITMYPTTTTFGGETMPCIRVRPQRPPDQGRKPNGGKRSPAEPGPMSDDEKTELARMEALDK